MEAFADISAGMDVDWDSGVFCAAMRSPWFPVYFHDYDIVQFSGVLRTTMCKHQDENDEQGRNDLVLFLV